MVDAGDGQTVLKAVKAALADGGVKSLYRGLSTSLYSQAISSTIFALFYEFVKDASSEVVGLDNDSVDRGGVLLQ